MQMRHAFQFAAILLFTVSISFAQFDSAEVLGTVRDASGSVVPKANILLANKQTGIEAKGTTDQNGNYGFFNVKVGRYTVSVQAAGFQNASSEEVNVVVNARQRVDFTLQVGGVSESVEVSGVAAPLETDSSERGQVIGTRPIVHLPLNGRNFSDLALLSVNIHRSVCAYAVPPREGAFNANGMRGTYNNFMLDGVDNNPYSTSNQGYSNQVAQPSPDAVHEFKVITGNYSAEYGRVGGAIVNVVMRSGTNKLHGTAYEFLRDTDLNAIGYIFGQRPATFQKPSLQRNQFGATIGGPIIKNRVFYFADYEGLRNLQKALNFDSLPTVADRSGVLPVTGVNQLTGPFMPPGRRFRYRRSHRRYSASVPRRQAPGVRTITRRFCSRATTETSSTLRSTARSTIRCRHFCVSASVRTISSTSRLSPVLPGATATAMCACWTKTRRPLTRGA